MFRLSSERVSAVPPRPEAAREKGGAVSRARCRERILQLLRGSSRAQRNPPAFAIFRVRVGIAALSRSRGRNQRGLPTSDGGLALGGFTRAEKVVIAIRRFMMVCRARP